MADEGLDIHFGSMVERIELGDGAQARITCRDGTTYLADAVIITVSLGVLKVRPLRVYASLSSFHHCQNRDIERIADRCAGHLRNTIQPAIATTQGKLLLGIDSSRGRCY